MALPPRTDLEQTWEKTKLVAQKVADKIPLPLHYILNGFLIITWLLDLVWIGDPIPLLDEIALSFAAYYYNVYIIQRTFGILNPIRIFGGQTPVAKRRLGLLPYEHQLEQIKARIKAIRQTAKRSEVPGLDPKNVDRLLQRVKEIEKRLVLLDRVLTRPAFQEGNVKSEIARIAGQMEMVADPELKQEYGKAIEHAKNHLANIERLFEERNRLVARLDRFHIELDNTYSQVLALNLEPAKEADTARLFDELFQSVNAFDTSLQELAEKPRQDHFSDAVKEIEETEAKVRARLAPRETDKLV